MIGFFYTPSYFCKRRLASSFLLECFSQKPILSHKFPFYTCVQINFGKIDQKSLQFTFPFRKHHHPSYYKQRTDLQAPPSNFVKRKHLIEELYYFGITSTYDEFLLIKGYAAYAAMENSQRGCATTEDNQKLVQDISDNFDCNILPQNGVKQTHSMAVKMKKNIRLLTSQYKIWSL